MQLGEETRRVKDVKEEINVTLRLSCLQQPGNKSESSNSLMLQQEYCIFPQPLIYRTKA